MSHPSAGDASDHAARVSGTVPDVAGPAAEGDPDATFSPTGHRAVADVWGRDFEGVTPQHTLKGPAQADPLLDLLGTPASDKSPQAVAVDGYELIEKLGEGGAGIVYRAVQQSLDRTIAFKMIKARGAWDCGEKDKFIAEALVTGRLDHPNIVPIHELGATADGQPFYTMKMVRGQPWREVMPHRTESENLSVLMDVCDAVSFAHARHVVHRDLKPENIMLGEFGEVQLMDWGVAAAIGPDGELSDASPDHAAGGTPAYMAPEMATGEDGPVGIHSDVYLLGAILYQIITGQPPHPGKRVLDALENARDNIIQPTDNPGALLDIAMKAMQTCPADRYRSAGEFKQALLDYQSHAESIKLSAGASDDLDSAKAGQDYERFAQALFGFRQALALWPENHDAQAGIAEAQHQYARCAFAKGDLDLARSTLDDTCDAHQSLLEEVRLALVRREVAQRRLRRLRRTAISLTAAVVAILTVASIWIYAAKQEAESARETAVAAQQAEAQQRQVAEGAMLKAQEEEARAVRALTDLEKAYKDLVEAQEQERRARQEAKASEEVATKTRDELARTGMLLDNSWWVFDAKAAREAQERAAEAIGRPVELTIALADGVELLMVLVPPGEFVMGSPPDEHRRASDEHLHRVQLTQAYYLSRFELTAGQWQAIMGEPPPAAGDRDADPTLPVVGVSCGRIMRDLLPALAKRAPDGYAFRLPTEAEWEYACRAGTSTPYGTGADETALASAGWFLSNSNRKLQPVGGRLRNAFGLHDMHGNAGEICADQYAPGFYLESPTMDPLCRVENEMYVVRGGSVMHMPEHCRAAYRSFVYLKNEYPFVGVRPALAPITAGQP